MKRLIIIIALVALTAFTSNAQTFGFEKVEEYLYIQYEVDPFGSLDKEGFNSVITIGGVGRMGYKGPLLDISGSVQTIYTNKHNETSQIVRYWFDWAAQVQSVVDISDRSQISGGLRGGIIHLDNDSTSGVGFYGGIMQWRYFFSKRLGAVISFTLDYASDLPKDERKNLWIPNHRHSGRGGLIFLLND